RMIDEDNSKSPLDKARKEIDQIDRELVSLLERRMMAVSQIAAFKKEQAQPVLDVKREATVLQKVAENVKNTDYKQTITFSFTDIMTKGCNFKQYKLSEAKKYIDGKKRRKVSAEHLKTSQKQISDSKFAQQYAFSRQIIEGDVWLMRSSGLETKATSRGYL